MADGEDSRALEIKMLARDAAELAISTLVDVMQDVDAPHAAKVKSADIILQRGFGAPERKVEQKVDVNIYDQRQAHLTALQRLAAKNQKALMLPQPEPEDAEFSEIPSEEDDDD